MERLPRPSSEALLSRPLLAWLAIVGVVMGGGTLGVSYWAGQEYGETVARTMAMVTFSLGNLAFSLATKDERHSAFSLGVMNDRPFIMASLASLATILLMTELGVLNRLLDTTSLTLEQWVICIGVALLVIVVSEIRKLVWEVEPEEKTVVASAEAVPAGA
jgi:Ca2+-transporting ATPase